ncbi:MAG: SpoIIIAH-like family protein [Oscillospiraceae bacterium]|jgi:stage III sporulation protein AH|nr:SpoIIIAH-like family protein [Oscillospiraceae bacterium]
MKTFKRNAVIITVALFVCAAAYLNWSYGQQAAGIPDEMTGEPSELTAEAGAELQGEGTAAEAENAGAENAGAENAENGYYAGLFYNGSSPRGGFFAEARISRTQARDAAVETLAAINSADGASRELLDEALAKLTAIADYSRVEAELEALIMARGFSDCVAFISDDGVKITVPAPQTGLSTVDVAKITEVVTSETEFSAAQLKIIEVK